jgi:hypothetical protein
MRKLWQTAIAAIFAAGGVSTYLTLTDHHVPAPTVAIYIATLAACGAFTVSAASTPKRRAYTCPTPGCGITFTTTGQDPVTDRQMRTLAASHALHSPASTARH